MAQDEAAIQWGKAQAELLDYFFGGFDSARRTRVAESVRKRLRSRRPGGLQKADSIVADLERRAGWHKRRPGDPRSESEFNAFFPPIVCRRAKALQKALGVSRNVRDLLWPCKFPTSVWAAFEGVLGILAEHAHPPKPVPHARLRSLESKVIAVLKAADLFAANNRDCADILAECKGHAGFSVSADPEARIAALRRAAGHSRGTPDAKSN